MPVSRGIPPPGNLGAARLNLMAIFTNNCMLPILCLQIDIIFQVSMLYLAIILHAYGSLN